VNNQYWKTVICK